MLALLALCLCAAACPLVSSESAQPGFRLAGSLSLRAGELRYLTKTGDQQAGPGISIEAQLPPGAKILPYQTAALGDLALITQVDTSLEVSTWAIPAADPAAARRHENCLPLLVDGTRRALLELPDDSLALGGLRLLGADGAAALSLQQAELLPPAAGEPGGLCFAALPGEGSSLIYPFGSRPQILAWDSASETELWRASLPTDFTCADLRMLAFSAESAVFMVQYDFEHFEIFCVDSAGSARSCARLARQPAFVTTFPGGASRMAQVQILPGGRLSILLAGGREQCVLDLASGETSFGPASGGHGELEEANSNPVGEPGVPGPEQPALPQGLLPTAAGAEWTIDALLNPRGEVLVLTSDGPQWLRPGA